MVDTLLAGGGPLLGWRGLLRLFVGVRRWVVGFGFLVGVLLMGVAWAEEGEVLDVEALHEVIREAYPEVLTGGHFSRFRTVGVQYPDDKWEIFLPFEKKIYLPYYEFHEYEESEYQYLPSEDLISPRSKEDNLWLDIADVYHVDRFVSGAEYDEIVFEYKNDFPTSSYFNDEDGSRSSHLHDDGSRYLHFLFSNKVVTVVKDAVLPDDWESIHGSIFGQIESRFGFRYFRFSIYLAGGMAIGKRTFTKGNDLYYGTVAPSDLHYAENTFYLMLGGITVRRDRLEWGLDYEAEIAVDLMKVKMTQMKDGSLLFVLPDRVIRLNSDGSVPSRLENRMQWVRSYPHYRKNYPFRSREEIAKLEERLGGFSFMRRYFSYWKQKFPCANFDSSADWRSDWRGGLGVSHVDCNWISVNDYLVDERRLYPLWMCVEDSALRARFLAMREKHLLPKIYCDFYLNHSFAEELAAFVGELERSVENGLS